MKSVLISIQPKWCELIANGKKSVEVRKTRPKIDTPFKCYIYCTLSGSNEFFKEDCGGDIAEWNRSRMALKKGKVIGEFVCDKIDLYEMEGYDKADTVYQNIRRIVDEDDDTTAFMEVSNDMSEVEISDSRLLKQSCLSFDDIGEYVAGGKAFGFYDFYGWHISDLVIYDKPKELSEIKKRCYSGCETCKYESWDYDLGGGKDIICTVSNKKPITRPPQSWCYVDHPTEKGGAE